jgi:hypothetical protein
MRVYEICTDRPDNMMRGLPKKATTANLLVMRGVIVITSSGSFTSQQSCRLPRTDVFCPTLCASRWIMSHSL